MLRPTITALTAIAASLLSTAILAEASTLKPPVLPLVVRNPYLSVWLPNARDPPWQEWPMFWTGSHIGLSVLARVPEEDIVYHLLGRPQDGLREDDKNYTSSDPVYLGATYDASTTNLTYLLPTGPRITLSFLSPITPTSTLRQAIPASYLTVTAEGNTNVDVYIDLNGQWVSGDRGRPIRWAFNEYALNEEGQWLKFWSVTPQDELLFTEHGDQAEWGTLHFSGPPEAHWECGTSALLRQKFAKTGTLENIFDGDFRPIMDEEPVFAFAKAFHLNGTNSTSTERALFTIAHTQDQIAQFAAARGLTMMRPLWASYFANIQDLLLFHYLDYHNAFSLSDEYSKQLAADAYKSGADDYVDIVALSARQVLGATTFSGTPENPILFLKEISSNGNFQTIDVIYPSFPFFLYTNPRWLAYVLEPLLEHMLSGQWPKKFAIHDLGTHFPNATGHSDGVEEDMPVEECGNIMIMGLALANALQYTDQDEAIARFGTAGDETPWSAEDETIFPLAFQKSAGMPYIDDKFGGNSKGKSQAKKWVDRSYRLWEQWVGFLVEESLYPTNQLSTDDFAGPLALQTGLALKGAVGIRAMAELAKIVGRDADFKHYLNISTTYIAKWEELAVSRDKTHVKLAYDWYGSWTTIYNLFTDALLCFHLDAATESYSLDTAMNSADGGQKPLLPEPDKSKKEPGFVPRRIYQMQSDWYLNVRQKYGVPLDQRHMYTKTDWEFFAMAAASRNTRGEILQSVAQWLNETSTDRPFTDLHKVEEDGGFPGPNFFARPVVGGHFAFLALERACGGKGADGLKFLDEENGSDSRPSAAYGPDFDVRQSLQDDFEFGQEVKGDWKSGAKKHVL